MKNAILYEDEQREPAMTVVLYDDRVTTLEKLCAVISRRISMATGAIGRFTGKAYVDLVRKGKRRPYDRNGGR
ncbi:MAG: hypothetical protein KA801_02540 [Syntrophorhabdaceae bacterium]|nr:hypothetical protein [Syntrophorhabdaceae bacterium]